MNPHRIPGKHHYSPEELAATLHVHKEPNPNITDLAMKTCPRCLKPLVPDSVHTCTPTPYARGMEAELERLESAFLSQANELGTAIRVLEDIHPDCAQEYRYRVYPRLHHRPEGFRMPSVGQRGIGDSDISALLDERDALKSQLDALGARLAGAEATAHGLKLERDALTDEVKRLKECAVSQSKTKGLKTIRLEYLPNYPQALCVTYPHRSDEDEAKMAEDIMALFSATVLLGLDMALKAENAALTARVQALEDALEAAERDLLQLATGTHQGSWMGFASNSADSIHTVLHSTPALNLSAHDEAVRQEVVEQAWGRVKAAGEFENVFQ